MQIFIDPENLVFGSGQSYPVLSEEALQEFEVN